MTRPDPGYLTRGDTAPQRLAVGGLLAVLGVTWPLLLGYAVGVLRATFRGEAAPPEIDEWAPIVRDGAFASAIVVAFALPPAILATLTGWSADSALSAAGLAVTAVGLASAYAMPSALARFAHRETLVAGLDCWTLLDVVLLTAYARTWIVLAVAAGVLLSGSRLALSVVAGPAAGGVWIVATLLGYALLVLGTRAVGQTYARIMRLEPDANGVARRSEVDTSR
jgi:hypothetical protein